MTPEELARQIALIIAGAEDKFTAAVGRVQNSLYERLISTLKNLETDSQGYILQSGTNRTILRESEGIFDSVIRSGTYQNAVSETIGIIPDIDSLNASYFQTVSDSFKINRAFLKSLQKQVIETVNVTLLQDGLTSQIKLPLNQLLNQNVNAGGSFSGMLEQLRKYIIGGENEGKLLRYSRTYLTDTLFNYSRAYQEAVTADLKLEWYLYQGGLTGAGKKSQGSREFCIERAGKFYHRSEIESWANLKWAGKNPATTQSSIFIYAGGYQCRHSIIPVHSKIVPVEDLERIKKAS